MKFFIISTLLVLSNGLNAQQAISMSGKISDCEDQEALFLGTVYLWQKDSIIAKSQIDENGAYHFTNLQSGTFMLKVDYLFFSNETQELHINQDTIVNHCLKKCETLLLNKSKLNHKIFTLYYFGLPKYDDEELNEIGINYGVRFANLGCEVDNSYSKYIELVEKLLVLRNGANWKQAFWKEVETKLK